MPKYADDKARANFHHAAPKIAQHAPHLWSKPIYGQKVQYAENDNSKLLNKPGALRVQSISGTCLYYARAVDPTILPALNEISKNQAKPTEVTGKACDHLLDYLTTHPDAIIPYYVSDMIHCVVSDAAYLVLPKARAFDVPAYTTFSAIILPPHLLRLPPTVPSMFCAKHLVVFQLLQLKPNLLDSAWVHKKQFQ